MIVYLLLLVAPFILLSPILRQRFPASTARDELVAPLHHLQGPYCLAPSGSGPDPEMARSWYERARVLGSTEAEEYLLRLSAV